jgi:hypothetical protein
VNSTHFWCRFALSAGIPLWLTVSCTPISSKQNTDTKVKFDSVVSDRKGNETVIFFEVDEYLKVPRVCVILSTINKDKLVREGKSTDLSGKLVPDELTEYLFKNRKSKYESFLDEKLRKQMFPDAKTEDLAWENLVLHLRYGTSKSVGFGIDGLAHPIHLKEFGDFLKANSSQFKAGATYWKELNELWNEQGRQTVANLILGVMGAGMYATLAPYILTGVLGISAVQFGWVFVEKQRSKNKQEVLTAQDKILNFLPKAETVEQEHGNRLLADGQVLLAQDVYQTFSSLLSQFSKLGKSEAEIVSATRFPDSEKYRNDFLENLFTIHKPYVFNDLCPKTLGHAQSLKELLLRD